MLPIVTLTVNQAKVRALVDTGCEQSVLLESLCQSIGLKPQGHSRVVSMLNGETTVCKGVTRVCVQIGDKETDVSCLVAPGLVRDVDMILGMDAIGGLGGVRVGDEVEFGSSGQSCAAGVVVVEERLSLELEDSDFCAKFDGGQWVVQWKWSQNEPHLVNRVSEYAVSGEHRDEYEEEVRSWIEQGWLEEYDEQTHGIVEGVIPLMAAKQPNKPRKVRPVMDYRELNSWVKSNPGVNSVVCQEKLRSWRKRGSNACLLDLKKAYLQIHVDKSLQRFQAVRFQGKLYVMTRMGFGLNVAPKIMSRIIDKVLSLDETIAKGTDHYIDDIWIDMDVVEVERVRAHLTRYGLVAKDPELLSDARVLGLRVSEGENGCCDWQRDGQPPVLCENLTKRELFSWCGKVVGHYPVAGWLRTACSYIRRLSNGCGWDEKLPPRVEKIAQEMMSRVMDHDPVGGVWSVSSSERCRAWCDASSLAIGVSLEVGGRIVEDAAWLRKESDGSHINVAELEAVLKGLTLALKWNFTQVELVTDSATVFGWVRSVLEDERRPRVSGLGEMIVRRRLGLLAQIREEYEVELSIKLVRSAENKADSLTRVPSKWMHEANPCTVAAASCKILDPGILAVHNNHHFGTGKTKYLAEKILGHEVSKDDVEQVVLACHLCRSIDPQSVRWNHGTLEVENVWERLAVDVTFVSSQPYLSVVDCGPSRFAIWQRLLNETSDSVIRCLSKVFCERGPPQQLLSDNGPCFSSRKMKEFLGEWGVEQLFSGAYRHSGNGIVERNHRTIKRSVARSGESVDMIVYWYNNSPRSNGVVPAEALYRYHTEVRGERSVGCSRVVVLGGSKFSVGDRVYVKPVNARCTSVWSIGIVTRVVSDQIVEVDGVNRHVADLRSAESTDDSCGNDGVVGEDAADVHAGDVEIGLNLWDVQTDDNPGDHVTDDAGGADSDDDDSGDHVADDAGDADSGAALRRSDRCRQPPERYGTILTH